MSEAGSAVEQIARVRRDVEALRGEIAKRIVGNEEVVEGVVICLLCGGHALLEGAPGLGKTLLVKSLSQALNLSFSRMQFTPDLMPADLIGTTVVLEDDQRRRYFQFQKGPIFAHIVLADEINRATPKTQSALLEAMQEGSVTVSGHSHRLEDPFMVLATQNPIEMEGTYPLPEAQLDRFFFKLHIQYPGHAQLLQIIDRTTEPSFAELRPILDGQAVESMKRLVRQVPVAGHVKDFAIRVILATHPDSEHAPELARKYVRYGSSPRGVQSLVLAAKARALLSDRFNVSFDDLTDLALPSLRHRIILNFEGEAEGVHTDQIITQILERSPRLQ